jgi:hypothetical protein
LNGIENRNYVNSTVESLVSISAEIAHSLFNASYIPDIKFKAAVKKRRKLK